MRCAIVAAMMVVGYLSGSVNFAIIVTRLRTGKDIRDLGNANPGTANVGRSLGRGWGALVLLGDVLKGLIPMLAARRLFFGSDGSWNILAVFAIGLAGIVGHCRPIFHRFRGGGGIAASLPVFSFFAPIEFGVSMLLGALIVALFVRNVQFRIGRWIPMAFVTLAPFLTAAVNAAVSVPLGGRLSIGGHPWAVPIGMLATSVVVLAFNLGLLRTAFTNLRASRRA
ncbi:MAG: glycerol-3-phosphate acyltransferase [Spirochaetes bacterium]|nr:glycerol-3-phosphate acyltransferase [Spirochaetota bacterium]